jgi:hypothetical protein
MKRGISLEENQSAHIANTGHITTDTSNVVSIVSLCSTYALTAHPWLRVLRWRQHGLHPELAMCTVLCRA